MEEMIDVDSIVRIETLPKVFYQLDQIKETILPKIEELKTLECTEDNKKEIKKYRSEVNNLKNILETKRKAIKRAILEPYETFDTYYTQNVKNVLEDGLNALDEKIQNVETEQLNKKASSIFDFFEEWVKYYHLENIVKFEDLHIKITLSASEKSLKSQIKESLEKISNDMECISSEENRDAIFYEYQRNGYDYTKAKLVAKERQKSIDYISGCLNIKQEQEQQEQEVVEKVEEVITPIEIETEFVEFKMRVIGTKEELQKLIAFFTNSKLNYEIIE